MDVEATSEKVDQRHHDGKTADDVVMFECPRSSEGSRIPQLRQTKALFQFTSQTDLHSFNGVSSDILQVHCQNGNQNKRCMKVCPANNCTQHGVCSLTRATSVRPLPMIPSIIKLVESIVNSG